MKVVIERMQRRGKRQTNGKYVTTKRVFVAAYQKCCVDYRG